jgi:hypothetical protein
VAFGNLFGAWLLNLVADLVRGLWFVSLVLVADLIADLVADLVRGC